MRRGKAGAQEDPHNGGSAGLSAPGAGCADKRAARVPRVSAGSGVPEVPQIGSTSRTRPGGTQERCLPQPHSWWTLNSTSAIQPRPSSQRRQACCNPGHQRPSRSTSTGRGESNGARRRDAPGAPRRPPGRPSRTDSGERAVALPSPIIPAPRLRERVQVVGVDPHQAARGDRRWAGPSARRCRPGAEVRGGARPA